MARPEKVAVVEDVRDRFADASAVVLTEYRGLSVSELAELRARLRETEAVYKIAKNTLIRRAVSEAGVDVPDELLVGPTAITFCAGDPVATAKVLRKFSDDHPALVVKGGVLDGRLLDGEETRKLADLASREELLAKMAGMLGTLLAQPARLAQANLDKLARVLGAYQRQREEGGEVAEAPAEPPTAALAPDEGPAAAGDAETPTEAAPEPDSAMAEAVVDAAEADDDIDATPEGAEPASKPGATETEPNDS